MEFQLKLIASQAETGSGQRVCSLGASTAILGQCSSPSELPIATSYASPAGVPSQVCQLGVQCRLLVIWLWPSTIIFFILFKNLFTLPYICSHNFTAPGCCAHHARLAMLYASLYHARLGSAHYMLCAACYALLHCSQAMLHVCPALYPAMLCLCHSDAMQAMLRHVMLCYAMLMLCYVMPCDAM